MAKLNENDLARILNNVDSIVKGWSKEDQQTVRECANVFEKYGFNLSPSSFDPTAVSEFKNIRSLSSQDSGIKK